MAAVGRRLGRLLALTLWGCSLPEEPTTTRIPDVPPVASLQLDLSFFATHTPDGSAPSTNWAAALEKIAFIDSAAGSFFVVPAATIAAARTVVLAERDGSGWRWPYATNLDGQDYSGYLRGVASGSQDSWALVVNAPGLTPTISNYLWAEGVSVSEGRAGAWAIYQPAFTGPIETVILEFSIGSAGPSLLLRRVGSDLFYTNTTLTGEIDYTSSSPGESFRIFWTPATGAGRIALDRVTFVCWDAAQHDVTCS